MGLNSYIITQILPNLIVQIPDMKCIYFIITALYILPVKTNAQLSPFEKSDSTETATYTQIVNWYNQLDRASAKIKVIPAGMTDAGYPLQLVMISNDGIFDPVKWHKQNKVVILINNGIHPGEPDGIDASMILARDIKDGKIILPENIALAIIPVYNIGGCLNRNSHTRVNQHGPVEYGFRGNSQNLDLNRDFTKCDSKEAMSFTSLFHSLNPDIFIETHVSDGADYQHTMTLISTQYNKLGAETGKWMNETFEPHLHQKMLAKNWDMIPYVDFEYADIEKGFHMFYDPPRYSSGYAAMFNTFSFITETHMLKPFRQRVKSTYDLMLCFIETAYKYGSDIIRLRKEANTRAISQVNFPLKWVPDNTVYREINFSGYEKDSSISEATGLPKMFFNQQKPFSRQIRYYHSFRPENEVKKPIAYIIPRGWHEVIDRLALNGVKMASLEKDSIISVTVYRINSYKSMQWPYEKHHKNYQVNVTATTERVKFLRGDHIISMNQPVNRYIVEMLEPAAEDGFFAWNFFDAVLQQKEGYSDYRWEEIAAEVLKSDPSLYAKLEEKKASDPVFAANSGAILDYIYKNSIYYEKAHLRYPVYRLE